VARVECPAASGYSKVAAAGRRAASQRLEDVAVGIRITPYPPHRSGRADFPHPALASGCDVQTARWIRVADMGRREPSTDEPLHSLPLHAPFLALPLESAVPEVTDREATSRVRSSSAPVLELPDASREHWLLTGEPGISQLPCKMCPYVPGSQTAQDFGEARFNVPPNVAFRVVSGRRRPEVRGISRLDNLAHSSSCLRFVSDLAVMPARLGAGVAR
jgi:hypothetical protein